VADLILNVFLHDTGHHEASWRHPASSVERINDVGFYADIARTAERACLDAVFLADVPGLLYDTGHRLSHGLEPVALLSALSAVTERIGLIGSASTTLHDPYTLARLMATLDHVSRGRAGWNVVTTYSDAAARNYGLDDTGRHADRYARAEEFLEVVGALWDSWEDDAVVADRERGVLFDVAKVHPIDHAGERYRVRGPLNLPRSPQGRPVLVQAGSSNTGRDFAARHAEVVFTAHQQLQDARAFRDDVRAHAASFGRDPDRVRVLPGISPVIGDTEAEARDLARTLDELTVPAYGLAQLGLMTGGMSFDHLDLDEPVPAEMFRGAGTVTDNVRGRFQVVAGIVEREAPTLRGLLHRLAGARGHHVVAGTPAQVADTILAWVDGGAADGFNVMPPLFPQLFDAFAEQVVPILQDRGRFRTAYAGTTLREHYGLPRPASRYAAG
jgi:FMN-dependent oxidoreductase (nitrilotriacetate monooxygenase family)